MKAALVYTSTTPELIELVNREVRKNIGEEAEILSLQNPGILQAVRDAGYVTPKAAADLIAMYMDAVSQGADAILNICSSVGEVADCMQTAAADIGVPIVRIDEEMCREAVRLGSRIAVLATLPTTLAPTKNTVLRVAREMGRHVKTVDGLINGAFGLDQEQFRKLLLDKAAQVREAADVILLAQGSMAYVEEDISRKLGIPTLSSPRFGAIELRKALERRGLRGR
jgi:Asp/Glu/hydantoin racemase